MMTIILTTVHPNSKNLQNALHTHLENAPITEQAVVPGSIQQDPHQRTGKDVFAAIYIALVNGRGIYQNI